MTAKEYLEQLPDMKIRIAAIQRKINELRDRATDTASHRADIAPQFNGNVSQKVAVGACSIADYEQDLERMKSEFTLFERRASAEINTVPNSILSALLFEKYINGLSWEETAEAIGKDTDYVRKDLHGKAIAKFDEIIPENTRKNPVISV